MNIPQHGNQDPMADIRTLINNSQGEGMGDQVRLPAAPVKGCSGLNLVREAKGKRVADRNDELLPVTHHDGRLLLDLEP